MEWFSLWLPLVYGALAVLVAAIVGLALAGRRLPFEPIELACPLRSGTYLIVNGGSQARPSRP